MYPARTPKNSIDAISGTYWTIAYRKPRANRFQRATDLATTWDHASTWAHVVATVYPDLEVWVTTTLESERVGYTPTEDSGNILTNTGKRVQIVDTGSLASLERRI